MRAHKELTRSDENDFKLLCVTYSVALILLLAGSILFFSSGTGRSSNANMDLNVTNSSNTTSVPSGAGFDLTSSILFFVLGGLIAFASIVFCASKMNKFFSCSQERLISGSHSTSALDLDR